MISERDIIAKAQEWAASPAGKKRIGEILEERRKTGKSLASGEVLTSEADMLNLAETLKEIIYKHLPESIRSVGETLSSSAVKYIPSGTEVELRFDKDATKRKSLYEKGDPDGIENIVALLNNGYRAENYVYGYWKGNKIRSKKEREPLQFMQDAVREFNNAYGAKYNVTAVLSEEYTK